MAQDGFVYDSYNEMDRDFYRPNDRMYVRPGVYLPYGEVDPRTGMLRKDVCRLGRTQALRMEAKMLDQEYTQLDAAIKARAKEKGIRIPLRFVVIGFLALMLILSLILLVQQGLLTQRQRMLSSVNERIETLLADNTALEQKIAVASDSTTVCYAAARDLGMVPADSTQAIHLTAMDTRPGAPASYVTASAGAQTAEVATANASH